VCQLNIYNSFPVIRTTIAKKSSFLRTQAFIFCLPWGRPCGNHAKRCTNEKHNSVLAKPLDVPIYLEQFPSYSNRKCKKSQFSRTAAHIFVSPGDARAIITQYVAWMERQCNACRTSRSMYPSIFNSFPVIQTASAKNRRFHVPQPTFLFPLETPPAIITQSFARMERQFNACQTSRSMYLCIYNSFRVIRCLSQCVSPKIAIFTTFWFPLGTPLGQSR